MTLSFLLIIGNILLAGIFAHEGEHGLGGGEEFGFGDVADDLRFANGSGKDEGADAAAVLFVATGESDEFFGGGFESRQRSVAKDQVCDSVGIVFADGVASYGYAEGCDAAPGDGFAVEELLVVRGGLDSVTDGMAEVQDHAQAGLFFVLADDVGFDAD